jgi:hypothetical protein
MKKLLPMKDQQL